MLLNERGCLEIDLDSELHEGPLLFGLFTRFVSQCYGTVTLRDLKH